MRHTLSYQSNFSQLILLAHRHIGPATSSERSGLWTDLLLRFLCLSELVNDICDTLW